MIQVHELHKRYGETVALRGLSFGIGRGEILGLLGPNGAGKTTTLRILTGFMTPDAGRVEFEGRPLAELGRDLRRRTGYLPEANPLTPDLTVRGHLDFTGSLYGLAGARLREARERVVERCGLAGLDRRPARALSKGQRQRLGLAQALLHEPELLFLDEPTAGLDPLLVSDLRDLIRGFGGERTVVLSTHVLSEVEAVCNRVLILDRGRAVAEGSLEELGRSLDGGRRLELRARFPDGPPDWAQAPGVREATPRGEAGDRWLLSVDDDPEAPAVLAAWVQERGGRLYELQPGRAGLEEIFLRVVRGEVGP
ncbi:MAG: ABC transporter ATP-binding protein [Candidatus Krumholzibacteriota bacterium]|nr:ABC transporter ATP-binding protein [Candidatus Krumholzibacteriota bacterium]